MFRVYFAESTVNGKIYVGSTEKDPDQRVTEYNHGTNSFTKSNGPFKLIYYESYHCKMDTLYREKFYKTGFGRQIKNLIVKSNKIWDRSSISAKG